MAPFPNDTILRAITSCEIEGNSEILNLYAVPFGNGYRVGLHWMEQADNPELVTPVVYVDVESKEFQVIDDPNEPFELYGGVPPDVPWVHVDVKHDELTFFKGPLPSWQGED